MVALATKPTRHYALIRVETPIGTMVYHVRSWPSEDTTDWLDSMDQEEHEPFWHLALEFIVMLAAAGLVALLVGGTYLR